MTKALDQGFKDIKAKLETTSAPYDPFLERGDADDPAQYVAQPGVNFLRPWIAIRNGPAFQWPLGMEGVTVQVDPTLGIHKYIGGNAVTVDVIHAGEEHFTMTGNFPGNSAPDLVRALRDIVYQGSPSEGKILWLPEIVTYAQRVQIASFSAARTEDARGRDMTYSIEFVRLGMLKTSKARNIVPAVTNPTHPPKAPSTRNVHVDSKHNTLRKIARWKLGSATKWRTIYNKNRDYFVKHKVPLAKAPDYRIPNGTYIHY